ncbi:MAG: FAD-dependent oxidoreductase [Pseudomonadota bacterium]
MATAEITVRGAGIFGLSVAWACVQRGARVRVIDPAGPGGGASGGIVGALAPHVPENWNTKKAFQLDSLLAAGPFWRDVAAASGMSPGYARFGRLQPILDVDALTLARARAESAANLWGRSAEWSVEETGLVDWSPITPTGWLIRDTLSARLHPARACAALSAALIARGAEICPEASEEGAVIHATGWKGLEDLSAAAGRTVGVGVKGQAVLLRHRAPEGAPQIFSDGLHIVPHDDGTVAVGSTTERNWDDPGSTDDNADALAERATEALPILRGAPVIARWAGVRPRARSRAPILGSWPGRNGHFVANGGFKIGFGMAPGIARVMADLTLDGVDSIPDGFRVEDNL